jgi:hypothetical protein
MKTWLGWSMITTCHGPRKQLTVTTTGSWRVSAETAVMPITGTNPAARAAASNKLFIPDPLMRTAPSRETPRYTYESKAGAGRRTSRDIRLAPRRAPGDGRRKPRTAGMPGRHGRLAFPGSAAAIVTRSAPWGRLQSQTRSFVGTATMLTRSRRRSAAFGRLWTRRRRSHAIAPILRPWPKPAQGGTAWRR